MYHPGLLSVNCSLDTLSLLGMLLLFVLLLYLMLLLWLLLMLLLAMMLLETESNLEVQQSEVEIYCIIIIKNVIIIDTCKCFSMVLFCFLFFFWGGGGMIAVVLQKKRYYIKIEFALKGDVCIICTIKQSIERKRKRRYIIAASVVQLLLFWKSIR